MEPSHNETEVGAGVRAPRGRRWCIPPATLREPTETLEASGLLDEHRGGVGLVLWQSLRDVMLWAAAAPGERADLFSPTAGRSRRALLGGADPEVELPLTTLAALVEDPGRARPEVIALVCLEVSRWAESQGAAETALAYVQAAALAAPWVPSTALQVGTLALRQAKPTRAETWLRRTVGLARRAADWPTYAEAHLALAGLYAARGQRGGARRFLLKTLRAGRRHALAVMRARALHGLFRLALDGGEHDEAERFARGAIRAYGRGHPRLPELLHDVAALWVRQESYARALPLLQRLAVLRPAPAERAAVLALLARAAAGAGDGDVAGEAWSAAWVLLPELRDHGATPGVLADLARAAAALRDWTRMEQAVRQAVMAAARRGEPHLPDDVERLAASMREHKS